jgi:hypothetical protein
MKDKNLKNSQIIDFKQILNNYILNEHLIFENSHSFK